MKNLCIHQHSCLFFKIRFLYKWEKLDFFISFICYETSTLGGEFYGKKKEEEEVIGELLIHSLIGYFSTSVLSYVPIIDVLDLWGCSS